jgi:hypothetical protein
MTSISDNKACWNCLKKTMVLCPKLGAEWYKCSKCGATDVKMPKLQPFVLGETWRDQQGMEHQSPHPVTKGKKAKE